MSSCALAQVLQLNKKLKKKKKTFIKYKIDLAVFTDEATGSRNPATYVSASRRAQELARAQGKPLFCFDLNERGTKQYAVCSYAVLRCLMSPAQRHAVPSYERIKHPLCGYEYVLGERPTTLYFDMDGKFGPNPRLLTEEGLRRRIVERVIDLASRALEDSFPGVFGAEGAPVRRDEWMTLVTGVEKHKFSRHLVWRRPGCMFATGVEMRAWLRAVLLPQFRADPLLQICSPRKNDLDGGGLKCIVDEAVYNFPQPFRMWGMHKRAAASDVAGSTLRRSPLCIFAPCGQPEGVPPLAEDEWIWRLSLVQHDAGRALGSPLRYADAGSAPGAAVGVASASYASHALQESRVQRSFSPTFSQVQADELVSRLQQWLVTHVPAADSPAPPHAVAALAQWQSAGLARVVRWGLTKHGDAVWADLPRSQGSIMCPITGHMHGSAQASLLLQSSVQGMIVLGKCFCSRGAESFLGLIT